jgi:hypothetical protein
MPLLYYYLTSALRLKVLPRKIPEKCNFSGSSTETEYAGGAGLAVKHN